jgi:hypothetical protein
MWDDFYIGEKPRRRYNSAVAVWYMSDLSENTEEYWYSKGNMLGGRINKKSLVGTHITELIEKGKTQEFIELYAFKQGLSILKPNQIMRIISEAQNEAYDRGREDKAKEIRIALGV